MPSGVMDKVAGSTPKRRETYLGISTAINRSLLNAGGAGASDSFQSGSITIWAAAPNASKLKASQTSFSGLIRIFMLPGVVAGLRIMLEGGSGGQFKICSGHRVLSLIHI